MRRNPVTNFHRTPLLFARFRLSKNSHVEELTRKEWGTLTVRKSYVAFIFRCHDDTPSCRVAACEILFLR